jgi:uncharacterized membrane protein YphA (DoxX/SURF4 family)
LKSKGQDRFSVARSLLTNFYATLASRLVLGGVFLVAGVTKALDPGGLAASIRTYELGLPEWFVSLSAFGLPYLEILLGLYLLVGLFTKVSAWTTNAIMVVFILALLQGALRGLEIDCGCFGNSADGAQQGSLWLDVLRDFGLLALGLHIALAPTGRLSVDALLRRDSLEDEAYEA